MRFAEMTAPTFATCPGKRPWVVAPIAACEQHSRHLPVYTDSILVGAVADAVEQALPDRVLLLPVLWLGASEHHLPFGGTLTASLATYEQMLVELLTPLLRDGYRRIIEVSISHAWPNRLARSLAESAISASGGVPVPAPVRIACGN